MSDDPTPTGQRFSHVYMKRGEPQQDSQRMRRRLAELVRSSDDLRDVAEAFKGELGIDIPYPSNWPVFFRDCDLQDVLDSITIAYRYLVRKARSDRYVDRDTPKNWCTNVQRIFVEENVHYSVDPQGGVHFRFDAEFEHNRAATIASLQGPRYRAALVEFEKGMDALAKASLDGKTAIRSTFAAAEALFKLMHPKSPRLTAQEAQSKLEPLLQRVYEADSVAKRAATRLLAAFNDWIDAAHFYRHEPGHQDPTQPPLALTVHMVSVGASFIRWLAELDATQPKD